ncbi:MAG: hypothetical protein NTV21_19375 [Planctomycetota bacterium]|nr:hypothetical protein [Planctomycetota bacterium]
MERRLELARRLALVLAGALVGLHFAPLGFMPLDQSICFDGGWRILCGQVPMRDYVAPNGFPVHALQALFFGVFGVSWLAYCLHAAVINGLAVGLVDRLLDLLGLDRTWSSVFALCTAFVFTPPFGVPYMDTHAFFFSLAALVCAVSAARAENATVRRLAAFATGPLLAAAYLSKQIPSVLFLPPVLLLALWAREERLVMLKRVLASLALTAVALVALGFALGVDWELVRLHWLELPSEEGARRLQFVPSLGDLAKRFAETRTELGLHGPTAAFLVALVLTALPFGIGRLYPRDAQRLVWPRAALGATLALAGLLFIAWTSNQKAIGVPLVFAAAGCTAAAFQALSRQQGGLGRRRLALALFVPVPLLATVCAFDARTFGREIDVTRKVNDLKFDAELAERSRPELPEKLSFLRWSVPKLVQYSPTDLAALVEYLKAREGGLFLVGDCSPLYALSGKVPTLPALWFHPGLTFPSTADERFAAFEERLLKNLEREDVRTIVIEPRVWIGDVPAQKLITLERFPRVKALVDARLAGERQFGAFRVLELSPR